MFSGLKGKRYFTKIDLVYYFYQMPITEKDPHKTSFRDADSQLWELNRAGLVSTVLTSHSLK